MEAVIAGLFLLTAITVGSLILGLCGIKAFDLFLKFKAAEAEAVRSLEIRKAEAVASVQTYKVDEATKKAITALEGKISKMEMSRLARGG